MTTTRAPSSEPTARDSALAIGNFDGVHRGHQALIGHTLDLAIRHGLRPAVMTFEPHPAVVLGGSPPPVLTRLERKMELLRGISPDLEVIVQRFDHEFAQLSPLQFVERILVGHVRVRELVVGANFRFGRDRAGTVEQLGQFGERFGFATHAFSLTGDEQGLISSSRIRELLRAGNVEGASGLLGRLHSVVGVVVSGDGRGRTLGFPTANLDRIEEARPAPGVYACEVEHLDNGTAKPLGSAVVHLGPRPTVQRDDSVEAHLIDQSIDLYDKTLRLSFQQRLRGLERFASLDLLKQQIELDIAAARRLRTIRP